MNDEHRTLYTVCQNKRMINESNEEKNIQFPFTIIMFVIESILSILYQFLLFLLCFAFFRFSSRVLFTVAYVSFKWKISTFHSVYFPWKTDLR